MKNQNEKIFKASLYLRLSREDGDKNESNSISNQKSLLLEFVSRNPNIEVVTIRVDDGYTGTNFNRPDFKNMLKDIQEQLVDCVIVKDLSRFGRDYIETGRYLQQIFPSCGIRFISLAENFDTFNTINPNQDDMVAFYNIVNDAYCRDISTKTRATLEIKRKSGTLMTSNIPYGYTNVSGVITIDEKVSQNVVDIFDMKLQGFNQQQIANTLNNNSVLSPSAYKKIKNKCNSLWTAKTVKHILTNEFYVGTLALGKTTTPNHKVKKITNVPKEDWAITENNHEPIIQKGTFKLVSKYFDKSAKISVRTQKTTLFSGLLVCADCGANLVKNNVNKNGKVYEYYMCGTSKANKGCSAHRLECNELYGVILEEIKKLFEYYKVELNETFKEIDISTYIQNNHNNFFESKTKLSNDIDKFKKIKLDLKTKLNENIITKQDYFQMLEVYSDKIDKAELELKKVESKLNDVSNQSDEVVSFIKCLKETKTIDNLTRRLLLSLIDKIIVHNKTDNLNKIEIQYLFALTPPEEKVG